MTQHFLTLMDLDSATLKKLTTRAIELKEMQKAGEIYEPFKNRVLGMIFDKSSTRTRVSFETGMVQLGGHAIFLSPRDQHNDHALGPFQKLLRDLQLSIEPFHLMPQPGF